uniref:Uncharacterized protein n=1 Tax=viral metagenome TaxID=1070528 RepID=A0A6C0HHA1_9ZZZZ
MDHINIVVYKQHQDPNILIPQHISRRAFVSATFFLQNCILAYALEYRVLCILMGSVYIATLLHWNEVKYHGILRTVDTMLANIAVLYLTFIDSYYFCPIYQQYWFYVFGSAIGGFAVNQYLLHMQITRYSNQVKYIANQYETWPLTLLNYTNPNTYNRELAYLRNTHMHMFFIHILPSISAAIFAILSHYQCNWTCESE